MKSPTRFNVLVDIWVTAPPCHSHTTPSCWSWLTAPPTTHTRLPRADRESPRPLPLTHDSLVLVWSPQLYPYTVEHFYLCIIFSDCRREIWIHCRNMHIFYIILWFITIGCLTKYDSLETPFYMTFDRRTCVCTLAIRWRHSRRIFSHLAIDANMLVGNTIPTLYVDINTSNRID